MQEGIQGRLHEGGKERGGDRITDRVGHAITNSEGGRDLEGGV